MTNRERIGLEAKTNTVKPETRTKDKKHKNKALSTLLQRLGNRSIQRLMVQRTSQEPYELDNETTGQISRERGSGAPLDSQLQMQMSEQMGFDMSGVRVHTSTAADQLNQQLNARAFTTGQDVFFRSGAYNPDNSSGKELIAHELTHVVQQGSGKVQNEGGMTVNAPGDQFEQEADSVAKEIHNTSSPGLQMQEEDELQMQGVEEEEELQMQEGEEEEELQMQEEEEELQMNGEEEEELAQA